MKLSTHVSIKELNTVSKSVELSPYHNNLSSWWHRVVVVFVLTSAPIVHTLARHMIHCTPRSCLSIDPQ